MTLLQEYRDVSKKVEEDLRQKNRLLWDLTEELYFLRRENADLKTWNKKVRTTNSSLRRQRKMLRKQLEILNTVEEPVP